MKGTLKPLWWSLFAAGGTVAAFLYPVHAAVTGVLEPSGALSPTPHAAAHDLVHAPLFRVYLVVLVALPLFHAAHRIMAAFMDFGLRPARGVLALLLYGGAAAGSAFALAVAAAP